jgi:hypothetical protein
MSEEKPKPPPDYDPPRVTSAIGSLMWKPRVAWRDDDASGRVVSNYNPLDALKRVPRFHD